MITQVVSTLVLVGPFCSLAGGKEPEIRLNLQGLFLFENQVLECFITFCT